MLTVFVEAEVEGSVLVVEVRFEAELEEEAAELSVELTVGTEGSAEELTTGAVIGATVRLKSVVTAWDVNGFEETISFSGLNGVVATDGTVRSGVVVKTYVCLTFSAEGFVTPEASDETEAAASEEPEAELVPITEFVGSFLSLHAAKHTRIANAKKKGKSFRIISPPKKYWGTTVNNRYYYTLFKKESQLQSQKAFAFSLIYFAAESLIRLKKSSFSSSSSRHFTFFSSSEVVSSLSSNIIETTLALFA